MHMINYPAYDAMHEKPDFTREQAMHPPKDPPQAQVYRTGVTNLSLTMYPFNISIDKHVPLKFLMTKRLSEIPKIY